MSKAIKVALSIIGVLILLAVIAGVAWLLLVGRGAAVGYRGFGIGPMRMFLFPFGGGLISFIVGVLMIGGIVWLVSSIFSGPGRPSQMLPPSQPEQPLDILKRRYAKGEITREQFDQMKQDLGV